MENDNQSPKWHYPMENRVKKPHSVGYLENTDNISGKHGQQGHGQHAKSNPNCNPNPNPDYYFT